MGREREISIYIYIYMCVCVCVCVCVKGMRTKDMQKWERIQPLKEGDRAREDTYLYSVVCVC